MSVAYGIEIQQENDPYIQLAEDANHGVIVAAIPGRFLVDSIPVLKHVPAWFPGASFKQKAREWYKLTRMMVEVPYADAKKRLVRILCFAHLQASYDHSFFVGVRKFYGFNFEDKPSENRRGREGRCIYGRCS